MDLPAPDPHGIIYRSDALAHGLTDRDLRQASSSGEDLVRIAPGCFAPTMPNAYPDEQHRRVALAVAGKPESVDGVLSHQSAAVIHRLALLHGDFRRVHFTSGTKSGDIRNLRHTHSGWLPSDEVAIVDGVAVTTLERTAVDLACGSRFPAALTVVDSALRAGADRDLMREILERQRRRGIGVARRAIAAGNALAENPGESWCRAQMITAGLPEPTLQRGYLVEGNQYFVDFDWDGRVVHEFDGEVKYGKLRRAGEDASRVVIREKIREDRLRGLGLSVDRSTWSDLRSNAMIPRLATVLSARGVVA
ncbi:type IV toxin-antitoxin system AbiEi family antitoxin domain-containing protein [Gordonia crocea]|uniref:CTP synthase n=1 Tax=Gordonia crocea TaxID=589162 RepID=A0A7I9UZ02_9ACTN|nr:hypothetical protein [Gordonia crocea]GED98183.1 hypothetical protein nbrc107697_22220 [Gordonia crocea]